MLLKVGLTALLIIGWHYPTTFFVPGGPPYERGWIIWPFGRQTRPAVDAMPGVLAPATLPATGTPTVALIAAGLASLAFLVALAGVWGFVVPPAWLPAMVTVGAAASAVLFGIYFSPLAVVPLIVDAIAVFLVVYQGGSLLETSLP